MKFLIYLFVFGFYGFITVFLQKLGITLGFIPTVVIAGACYIVAKKLCAKWDVNKFEKIAAAKGMTPGEYASTVFSPSILDLCESNKNNNALFEKLMGQLVEGEAISKSDANVLRYMFCRKYGK